MIAASTICSFGVLAVATVDDIRTRRVHNAVLLGLTLISVVVVFYFNGWPGLEKGLIGFVAGFALYFPLAWMGVVGGGDLKLMAVLGISVGAMDTLLIGVIALVWGALLGVIQVLLNHDFKALMKNIGNLAQGQAPDQKKLHKIPFTAAIFLAAA